MCDKRSPVRISSLNVFQALSRAKSLKDKGFYMTSMIIERLATKVAMEANAAISRRRSVIVVSRVLLCF